MSKHTLLRLEAPRGGLDRCSAVSSDLFVPEEDVATVAPTDDELAVGPVEVDPLHRGAVAVALGSQGELGPRFDWRSIARPSQPVK